MEDSPTQLYKQFLSNAQSNKIMELPTNSTLTSINVGMARLTNNMGRGNTTEV